MVKLNVECIFLEYSWNECNEMNLCLKQRGKKSTKELQGVHWILILVYATFELVGKFRYKFLGVGTGWAIVGPGPAIKL